MIKWRATGKVVKANGEKTVFYHAEGVPYWIESRTRWIQNNKNANQRLFTTYMVLKWPDEEVTEKYSLADAKNFVEEMTNG